MYTDIGHLGGTSSVKWYGIHLIEPIQNGSNGILNGMQLFTSSQGHATYVKREDIVQTLNTQQLIEEMQLIITTYSKKLDQYVHALAERDHYIEALKQQIKSNSDPNLGSISISDHNAKRVRMQTQLPKSQSYNKDDAAMFYQQQQKQRGVNNANPLKAIGQSPTTKWRIQNHENNDVFSDVESVESDLDDPDNEIMDASAYLDIDISKSPFSPYSPITPASKYSAYSSSKSNKKLPAITPSISMSKSANTNIDPQIYAMTIAETKQQTFSEYDHNRKRNSIGRQPVPERRAIKKLLKRSISADTVHKNPIQILKNRFQAKKYSNNENNMHHDEIALQQQSQQPQQTHRRKKSNSVGCVHDHYKTKGLKIRTPARRTSRTYKPRHTNNQNQYVQYKQEYNRRLSRGMGVALGPNELGLKRRMHPKTMMYGQHSNEEIEFQTKYPFNAQSMNQNVSTNYIQSSPQTSSSIYSPHGSIEQMNITSPPSLDIQTFMPAENPKFVKSYTNKY